MITFKSLASSSRGNAYLVSAPGVAPLLLEAGLPIKQLREKLNFGLTGLAGCLVSHEHSDHSKAVKDLLKAGIDCWMSSGTAKALDVLGHHRTQVFMKESILMQHHGWRIKPFPLEHDAQEPTGFLIGYGEDRLLFVPDTSYVENRFDGITIAAIECNNIEEILADNIRNGHLDPSVGRRVRRNHMSLENVIAMLKANDLSRLRQVWLLHLSNANADEKRMIREVQEVVGVPVYAA
jgi:phosphoribosyl 1,2-cyclic phosphodiesterase